MKEKKNLSLTDIEISRLGTIAKILKDTSHYHSSKFADADINLMLKLLESWPYEMMFPGWFFNPCPSLCTFNSGVNTDDLVNFILFLSSCMIWSFIWCE